MISGAVMDTVQQNTHAMLLIQTMKLSFCITVLVLHPIVADDCPGNCSAISEAAVKEIVIQEGNSVEVPLKTSRPVSDLCEWDDRKLRWMYVQEFPSGQKYKSSFKEHVSLAGGTFKLLNASKNARGIYKLQDNEANCVAWINITVKDSQTTTHDSSSSLPGPTFSVPTENHRLHLLFLLLLSVLLFML